MAIVDNIISKLAIIVTLVLATNCMCSLDAMEASAAHKQDWRCNLADCVINYIVQSCTTSADLVQAVDHVCKICKECDPNVLAKLVEEALKQTDKTIYFAEDFHRKTVLHVAATNPMMTMVIKIILALVEMQDKDKALDLFFVEDYLKHKALYYAVYSGNDDILKVLCDFVLKFNHDNKAEELICGFDNGDNDGNSLFHIAAKSNRTETLKILRKAAITLFGENEAEKYFNKENKVGKTPNDYILNHIRVF